LNQSTKSELEHIPMDKKLLNTLTVILFFFSCDTEKYLGYNYEADQFTKEARIIGKVTNLFTNEPVWRAAVQINDFSTITNVDGEYSLGYILSQDDEFNKEALIIVSAINYHSDTTLTLIFEDQIEKNFQLEYGAPIIEATVNYQLTCCQAIIFDYQGVDDIVSVQGHFRYFSDSSGYVALEFDTTLTRKDTVSANRAYYQAKVEPVIADGIDTLRLSPTHSITAIDKSGFTSVKEHTNSIFNPDTLLFDPN
jgi:hypothetical protein